MKVSLPLLRVLRIVDGDEKPAMNEVMAAMDYAKERIKAAIDDKPMLVKKVIKIVEDKWGSQMGVKLYGAALFLNPNRIYSLKAKPDIVKGLVICSMRCYCTWSSMMIKQA